MPQSSRYQRDFGHPFLGRNEKNRRSRTVVRNCKEPNVGVVRWETGTPVYRREGNTGRGRIFLGSVEPNPERELLEENWINVNVSGIIVCSNIRIHDPQSWSCIDKPPVLYWVLFGLWSLSRSWGSEGDSWPVKTTLEDNWRGLVEEWRWVLGTK